MKRSKTIYGMPVTYWEEVIGRYLEGLVEDKVKRGEMKTSEAWRKFHKTLNMGTRCSKDGSK